MTGFEDDENSISVRTSRNEKNIKKLATRAVFEGTVVKNVGSSVLTSYNLSTSGNGSGQIIKISYWFTPETTATITITVNSTVKALTLTSATVVFPLINGENDITVCVSGKIYDGQVIAEKSNRKTS